MGLRLIILLIIFFNTSQGFAQDGEPFIIAGSQTYHLKSIHNQKEYEIQLLGPKNFTPQMCKNMITIYAMDGNWSFSQIANAVKWLGFIGDVPAALVVGIGYPTDDDRLANKRRAEDLVPAPISPNHNYAKVLDDLSKTGNADEYAIFLRDQVMPFVEEMFCRTDERILSGYSFGGTFVTYVLFNYTDLFTRFMIGSPDYNHNNKVLFELENSYAKNHKDLNKHIFMATGSQETDDTIPGLFNMAFAISGRDYPNLKLQYQLVEGLDHLSYSLSFYTHALREILSDLK